jgi:methanogenic corrinoid protein MtbC1
MTDARIEPLIKAILDGDSRSAADEAAALRLSGVSAERIVVEGIETAMSALDAKCTLEQFNLLEIMLAGRAVTEVMKIISNGEIPAGGRRGTVVTATLEGDVHDLGKNIHKTVIAGRGFHVVDCGRDCPLDKLIEIAERERPMAIGISGLITPIIPLVRRVKPALAERGLGAIKVIAGGAALKQSSATRLNVDFVAESAFDSLHYLESLSPSASHE